MSRVALKYVLCTVAAPVQRWLHLRFLFGNVGHAANSCVAHPFLTHRKETDASQFFDASQYFDASDIHKSHAAPCNPLAFEGR